MNRRVDVVALIIARGDEVLVERRRLDREIDPGAVTIPGGHVEEGETFKEACRRELREELGLECARLRYLATYLHETTVEDQLTRYYVCEDWTGSPEPIEAAEVFFICREEAGELDFEIDRKALDAFYGHESGEKV
jgi:mutator protein MutT